MASADLCTVQDVRDWALKHSQRPDPTAYIASEVSIGDAVRKASDLVEAHCRREFAERECVEDIDGGADIVILNHRPVTHVARVELMDDSDTGQFWSLDESQFALWALAGYIERTDGKEFPKGYHNVRVVYRAGYDIIPLDVREACAAAAARIVVGVPEDKALTLDDEVALAPYAEADDQPRPESQPEPNVTPDDIPGPEDGEDLRSRVRRAAKTLWNLGRDVEKARQEVKDSLADWAETPAGGASDAADMCVSCLGDAREETYRAEKALAEVLGWAELGADRG